MRILGFNCFGHDSAAALLVDGRLSMAVEEERLNRKKHYGGFPERSIDLCLTHAAIGMEDVDHVGFAWDPAITYRKIPVYLVRYFTKAVKMLNERRSWTMEENLGMLNYLSKMRALPEALRQQAKGGKAKFKFHFLEHHFCHAASTYLCSPFEEAAIMTIDGAGEWATAMLAEGQGSRIKKLHQVETPHSLGAFYQAVSRHLGFALIEGPGKLMGLSSYGRKESDAYQKMRKLIAFTDDGGFRLDMSYFAYHYTRKTGVTQKFLDAFGPPNTTGRDWTEQQLDVAAAVQRIVEDTFIHMARNVHARTKSKRLCIAGGVGLNSVANGRLVGETPFKEFFIQPATGDSGTALGATLFINNVRLGKPRDYIMTDAFVGPEYPEAEFERELKKHALPFLETKNYAEVASRMLAKGNILGWFQGRLEFGPRALGNRSIIANPCLAEMKDVLNRRVKFREGFRPFAPLVLEDRCGEYFDHDYPSPYMLQVYNVRPEKRSLIPAVTHVDGTGRVQTVNQRENPRMWELITAFEAITGVPILINTSFNIKGEPIVCTPADAVDSFVRADMDFLIIGRYVAAKSEARLREFVDVKNSTNAGR